MNRSHEGGMGIQCQRPSTTRGAASAIRLRDGLAKQRQRPDSRLTVGGTRPHGLGRRSGVRRKTRRAMEAGKRTARSFDYAVAKRVLDLNLAVACLLLAAPAMAAIALGLALTLGRPILFSQQRVGRGGRLFRLYKFRTLDCRPIERSEVEWFAPASHPFAAFLRRAGLDELPQLVNVLRGEMSVVGPRPERPHFAALFEKRLPRYAARHCLRPGITGWAQVNGLRGDTSIARRLQHDLFYLNNWSLAFDSRILLLTMRRFAASLWAVTRMRADSDAGIV